MPFLSSVATALPPYEVTQTEARAFTRHHFAETFPNIERYLPIFEHSQIDTRHMIVPQTWFLEPHSFRACNDLFRAWALQLGEAAARACLERAGVQPAEIQHVIFVCTTGLSTPSIDAQLINNLGMGIHTRRSPIWGLGCAG